MESATERDREAIERQLGRPPRALAGVAARCLHGGPSVIAQRPYDEPGEPFPTTFWLSCRVLVRAVGELESSGGIAALEAELAARPGLRASRRRADARVAALRAALDDGGPRADGGAALATSLEGGAPGGAAQVPARPRCCRARRAALRARAPRARARAARDAGGLLRVGVSELSVRLAREDWRNGERVVERMLADPARAPIVTSVMRELQRELRRRLGQTYTLAMLVDALRRCGPLGARGRAARGARDRLGPRQRLRRRRLRARRAQRARLDAGLSALPPPPPPSGPTDELLRIERRRKAAVRQRRHSRLRLLLVLILLVAVGVGGFSSARG